MAALLTRTLIIAQYKFQNWEPCNKVVSQSPAKPISDNVDALSHCATLVAVYCYLERENDKALNFYINNCSNFETNAPLF